LYVQGRFKFGNEKAFMDGISSSEEGQDERILKSSREAV
jgi:hypothetical protein